MSSKHQAKNNNDKWLTHYLANREGAQLFLIELARRTGASRKVYSEINSLFKKLPREEFDLICKAAKENKPVEFSDGTKTKSIEAMANRVTNGAHVVGTGETTSVLYLLKSGEYYKIGCTTVLPSRLGILQAGNPIEIEVVHYADLGTKALVKEKELHHAYASKRVRGEWFKLTPTEVEEVIAYISKHSKGNQK